MDRHCATRRLHHLAEAGGVHSARMHPHMLRHTFVTTMLDAGVDLRDVQIAARHADPRTTMRYDRARKNLEVVRLPDEALTLMRGAPWVNALEPLTSSLPYDLAVTAGGVPTTELANITAPVLILGGANSPGWFQRSVAEQAAATPGAQLKMLDGYDHNAPPDVIAPILIEFFNADQ